MNNFGLFITAMGNHLNVLVKDTDMTVSALLQYREKDGGEQEWIWDGSTYKNQSM